MRVEGFWSFHCRFVYNELVFNTFAKLMPPKGVNEHLAERPAPGPLPVASLDSVILEDVPVL